MLALSRQRIMGLRLKSHTSHSALWPIVFVGTQALTLAMCPHAYLRLSGHHNLFSTGPRGQCFFFLVLRMPPLFFTGNRQNSEGNVNSYLFFVINRPNVQKCATSRVKS